MTYESVDPDDFVRSGYSDDVLRAMGIPDRCLHTSRANLLAEMILIADPD